MQKILRMEINKLKTLSHVNKKLLDKILKRIDDDPKLVKSENIKSHFCTFLVPINITSNSIYLGHHIKAQDWIPPGGHMEKDELPVETVKREFKEELNHSLTNEIIELFDITIKDVSKNPRNRCQIHHDFWYLVYTEKLNFKYDPGEFYDGGWFSFEEALKKIQTKIFNETVKKIHIHIKNKLK